MTATPYASFSGSGTGKSTVFKIDAASVMFNYGYDCSGSFVVNLILANPANSKHDHPRIIDEHSPVQATVIVRIPKSRIGSYYYLEVATRCAWSVDVFAD